jgi:putative addiction module component (TIGR02574 family)
MMSEEQFGRNEERLGRLDGRIDTLGDRVGSLDRQMHVLHEDVVPASRPTPGPTRAECRPAACRGWYISAMPHSLPLPPPGFDALPVEDQIDYVQSLWDRIAATAGQVPLQDWQEALLEERLAEHRRAPDAARPWEEVFERLQERLRTSR